MTDHPRPASFGTALTLEQRTERLLTFFRKGRITYNEWSAERDGREYACLLAAWSPEAAYNKSADACPADALPPWLAHLLPWMNDTASDEERSRTIARVVAILPRIHTLTSKQLERLDYQARRATVVEARQWAGERHDVLSACDHVILLCERVIAGDPPTRKEWVAARGAARAAASAAASAAAGRASSVAAGAAADAASRAASWAVLSAASSVAAEAAVGGASSVAAGAAADASADAASRAASWAASWAVSSASSSAVSSAASTTAAEAAASDRITNAILTAIEQELSDA